MRLIRTIEAAREYASLARRGRKSLGLVPTMGALHDGHLSLVRRARAECQAVVVSIFVNPTQFGPDEDFARYPRNLERDFELLESYGIDAVFAPSAVEVYPERFESLVDPGEIGSRLEGSVRPGHFRGVATIVVKLLNIVTPDVAYFGQKDFQQAAVIHRVVRDLNLAARLVICPIVRDSDGVAMSSRNAYLSRRDRKAAVVIHRCLKRARELYDSGQTAARTICQEMRQVWTSESEPHIHLDYAEIVEPVHLRPVDCVATGAVALVAGRIGTTWLIDNMIFGPPEMNDEELLQAVFDGNKGDDAKESALIGASGRSGQGQRANAHETVGFRT
jgi:pantoate--beta-alanine ligase